MSDKEYINRFNGIEFDDEFKEKRHEIKKAFISLTKTINKNVKQGSSRRKAMEFIDLAYMQLGLTLKKEQIEKNKLNKKETTLIE